MARIRTVKPTFFTSEDVARLSIRARLTWIGLWTHADDESRAKANLRLIKAAIYPLDDDITLDDVEADLAELHAAGRIVRYDVDGVEYLSITNWTRHQKINRPTLSVLPDINGSLSDHGALTEPSRQEGKGREGKGGAKTRPHPTCPQHPEGTDQPCRACGQARRAHDAWKPAAQTYPTVGEVLAGRTCEHGAPITPPCPLCRRGVAA